MKSYENGDRVIYGDNGEMMVGEIQTVSDGEDHGGCSLCLVFVREATEEDKAEYETVDLADLPDTIAR